MDKHYYFLRSFDSNAQAIKRRVAGDWLVRCGMCGVALGGFVSNERKGPPIEIIWRQEGAFFGTFYLPETVTGQ
jgi:hypothetical protein